MHECNTNSSSANTFLYTYSFSSCGYGECDRRGIDGHQMQRASYTCSTSISTKTRGVISHLSETKGGRIRGSKLISDSGFQLNDKTIKKYVKREMPIDE